MIQFFSDFMVGSSVGNVKSFSSTASTKQNKIRGAINGEPTILVHCLY